MLCYRASVWRELDNIMGYIMNERLSKAERGAFFLFGGMVFLLTVIATPSIMIVTFLDYVLNRKPSNR